MSRWLALAAVVAQVLVLAFMAGQREWVVRTGEPMLVRTAPIDPRDPMRGDYVRLDYEISTVPRALCRDGVTTWFDHATLYSRRMRDRRVYAVLERDTLGIVNLVALTDQKPSGGLFLRGRTQMLDVRGLHVRYGIEALFMEQGSALDFEIAANHEKVGVPINAEIAVSSGGLAVLRSYRWEPLGISMRLIQREDGADGADAAAMNRRRAISGAVVTIKNHGNAPVAIVDLPRAGSFRLVQGGRWNDGSVRPVERTKPLPAPRAADVVLLQPGDSREVELDFSAPDWLVIRTGTESGSAGQPTSIASLTDAWGAWLRIEYNPPSAGACVGLPYAEAIRHAPLRTRSFSPNGSVD